MQVRVPSARSGLTLMEVLVATVIFMFALAAIGQLISLGSARALMARFKQEGVIICESKLAELATGGETLPSSGTKDFGTGSPWEGWTWSATCEQVTTNTPRLWRVEVTAKRDLQFGSPVTVVMGRMIVDPNDRGSTLDPAPVTADQESGSSSSSSSNSTGGN